MRDSIREYLLVSDWVGIEYVILDLIFTFEKSEYLNFFELKD